MIVATEENSPKKGEHGNGSSRPAAPPTGSTSNATSTINGGLTRHVHDPQSPISSGASSPSQEPLASWLDSRTFSQLALSSQDEISVPESTEETIRRRNQQRPTIPSVFDVFAEMRGEQQEATAERASPALAQAPAPLPPMARDEANLDERHDKSPSVPPSPPPPPPPPPPPARPPTLQSRVVSWGLKANTTPTSQSSNSHALPSWATSSGTSFPKPLLRNVDRQTSTGSRVSSLGQPDLSDSHHDHSSGSTSFRPPAYRGGGGGGSGVPLPPTYRRNKSIARGMINLDDLTDYNPIESEAETYIIRSLEQREPSLRYMHENNPPGVMNNVPDDAVANMANSLGAANSLDDNEVGGSAEDGDDRRPEPETREADESNRNLARPVLKRGKSSAPARQHRRNLTMEQKLFGLASAIDEIHTKSLAENADTPDVIPHPPSGTGGGTRSRTNTLGSVSADFEEPVHEPISSVDAFQQNASILYRRIKKDDGGLDLDDSTHTKGSSSSHSKPSGGKTGLDHWQRLKASVKLSPPSHHHPPSYTLHPKKSEDVIPEGDVESQSGRNVHIDFGTHPDDDDHHLPTSGDTTKSPESSGTTTNGGRLSRPSLMVDDWKFAREVKDFLKPWKRTIRLFLKVMFLCIILPATGIATILFYLAGNPPTGILIHHGQPVNNTLINENGVVVDQYVASASWWLIFVCVRQLITFALAMVMELIVIDFFSIHSGITFKLFGAWPTLFILQARGWPFVLFFWSVFDFALLAGSAPFFAHWLYWQKGIGLFNASNPSGHVVDSEWNHRVLSISICVAFVTAVKRFLMGFYLGKNTFRSFSDKLATIMKKIILISEVASLSRDLEREVRLKPRYKQRSTIVSVVTQDKISDLLQNADDESTTSSPKARSVRSLAYNGADSEPVIDPDDRHPLTGALSPAQKTRIVQLLGAWEEPTLSTGTNEPVSVNALLQFRRALTCLNTDFPFSVGFGPAGTREEAIESSQNVFRRLLKGGDEDDDYLNFEVLATLGVQPDGSLDQQKLIDLIKLFRPNRDGTLSMIDFVKSTDSVYREIRLLRAAVANSSKIDAAFENIFNIFFYGIMIVVVLSQLGFDPLAMFLSISGVVLAFAFMIGSASAKYFEGLLFILVRRPYDIGDGIHVSDINVDTASSGSGWWLVEDVNLFTTTVMFMFTNERATLANGSLANSRIINATRSSHACVCNYIKLPIDVPYEKLQLFNEAIAQYVHNRPREWRALCSIRAINIETAQGFVEYSLVLEHRESWRSWAALRNSQAQLATFTIELCKKLDIWYKNPPVPVNLTFANAPAGDGGGGRGNVTLGPMGYPSNPTHNREGSALSTLSPGLNLDYSPDLRSLQAKFAPSKEAKH